MDPGTRRYEGGPRVPVRRVRVEAPGAACEGERVVVGSADDCDVRSAERTVSRYHAEITGTGEGIRVRDLGSTNGILCAGVRLSDAIVPSGAELELGALRVRVSDASLGQETLASEERLGDLVARSPAMRRLIARLQRAAASDASVLIVGDPGSGKELVARTLHAESARRAGPLVIVDASSLSGPLATSELFGHERGAFTDADEARPGAFERARGGTLVLDGVSELPVEAQPMLLGALERRSGRRLGGARDVVYDVRVVACASRDLRQEVNAGRFRLDLFYRLSVVRLEVPPLRERLDDVELLVARFLADEGYGLTHPLLDDEWLQALLSRSFSGNARGLRNVVLATLALEHLDAGDEGARDEGGDDAPHGSTAALIETLLEIPYKEARARFTRALEQAYLRDLAARARGNVSAAARRAGLDRSQLRQLLARSGVRIERER